MTGLVTCGDSAGGNFTIIVSLALRDEPAAVPVIAQWPIYPAADPGKGYPSYEDFGEGYFLTRTGMDWFEDCYRADAKDWRYAPLVKSQAGMPPTLVVTASLDPIRDQGRAYAAACIAGRRADHLPRGGGQYPRLHQPAEGHPLLAASDIARLRRGAEAAARRGREPDDGQGRPPLPPRGRRDAAQPRRQGLGRPAARYRRSRPGRCRRAGSTRARTRETARCASSRRRPASARDLVEIVARCPVELLYDLPDDLIGKIWKGKWRGQRQTWFLPRFLGEDEDVEPRHARARIPRLEMGRAAELPAMIVPFKKKLYEDVLEAFARAGFEAAIRRRARALAPCGHFPASKRRRSSAARTRRCSTR